jgi:poly(ADP-ribose) glycohydrolase
MSNHSPNPRQRAARNDIGADHDVRDAFLKRVEPGEAISKGTSLDTIINICRQPPPMKEMETIESRNCTFMISPFKYDPSLPDRKPKSINKRVGYSDRWDTDHVRMPCSPQNVTSNNKSMWSIIEQSLIHLRRLCDARTATVHDLKETIRSCAERRYELDCLERLINDIYSSKDRDTFMWTVLPRICSLALNVDKICGQPPTLLRIGSNRSLTMSQLQAASLLACAFFCLFPHRSEKAQSKEYENFPNPNFNRLYQSGPSEKIEKLKCILHYFRIITEKMPNGVISFRRYELSDNSCPKWSSSRQDLCNIHLTTGKRIEDVNCVLQVDFANQYIGGGVLGSSCVQEEIRFSICPEMIVSLLVCEMMEKNECVFLIGCERYSLYKGYDNTFEFDGDYRDNTPK